MNKVTNDGVLKELCTLAETETRQQLEVFIVRYKDQPNVVRGWINQSILRWFLQINTEGAVTVCSWSTTEHIFEHLGKVFEKEMKEVAEKELQTQS